jgi:hypothetical protein
VFHILPILLSFSSQKEMAHFFCLLFSITCSEQINVLKKNTFKSPRALKSSLEPHRTTGIVSVSAKNLSGERGEMYKLVQRLLRVSQRGSQRKVGAGVVSWWSRRGLAGATILQEFQTQALTAN